MSNNKLRRMLEYWARNRTFRRRLPKPQGKRPIWVSPDARLRYLKPGSQGFDRGLLEFIERFVRKNDVILDIGANIGEFALAAGNKTAQKGSVLAVEPDPYLASLITRTSREKQNLELGIGKLCAAVSRDEGISRFYVSNRGRASNVLAECGHENMGECDLRFSCQL